ncbi:MAG: T9SS type A sorting domain-containing protein [Ignavibacteriae bacterium]|nr:T9SS type A sorting domain-containing protein [Ignavibacteriota bacterium]
MKILTILFLFVSISFAQTFSTKRTFDESFLEQTSTKVPKARKMNVETYSLIHIIKTYSDSCSTMYNYSYDATFNKVQILTKHSNCSEWIEDMRITYRLDSNNYVIEEVIDFFENGTLYSSRSFQFLYDSNYNVINKKHSLFEGVSKEEFYTYNELNQIIEYSSSTTSSGEYYESESQTLYFYNDIGLLASIEGEDGFSSEYGGGHSEWNENYDYDSLGNLIEYKNNFFEETGLPYDFRNSIIQYSYNSDNQRIKELGKQTSGGWGEIEDSTMWQYDNEYYIDNKLRFSVYSLIDEISQTMDINGRTYFEYDSENNKVLILEELWDGEWINDSRIKYEYDIKGNCLSGISEAWTDSNWVLSKRKIGFTSVHDEKFEFDCERFEVFYSEVTEVENALSVPNKFELSQNFPNPFNPTTVISYSIPKANNVTLQIFDVLGREVLEIINQEQLIGSYQVLVDATQLTSGIYYYRLQAGDFIETKKMVLLK